MVDKNGVEMKTGDVVLISGAFFKNDNGLWFIERSPGDPSWCGSSYSLTKLKRNGQPSTAKYNLWLCDDLVRWCTATKWSGGYEADTPFKDGLMLIAVDDTGAEIGMEVTYQTQWNGEGLAEKELPFSWEAVTEY